MKTMRLHQVAVNGNSGDVTVGNNMMIGAEQSSLEFKTFSAVEELRLALAYQGEGVEQKRLAVLCELSRLLSPSEKPSIMAALNAGAVTLLVQCLSFGYPDKQLYEAACCLNNIAESNPEGPKSLGPALPLLIAHLEENRYLPLAARCALAIGNIALQEEELRNILISLGALPPLTRMLLHYHRVTVRCASYALANLIMGPDPKAALELIRVDGVFDAFLRHLRESEEVLVEELVWVVASLAMVSPVTARILIRGDLIQLLVERLATSNNSKLLAGTLRALGELVLADRRTTEEFLAVENEITDHLIGALIKCLKSEDAILKRDAAWFIGNIAARSLEYKILILRSEIVPVALSLFSGAPLYLRKWVAFIFGNICVALKGCCQTCVIPDNLVSLVRRGCLSGYIDLMRSGDLEAIFSALQFIEMVLLEMPYGVGQKLVEKDNGVEELKKLQFHTNEDVKCLAINLVNTYFGKDSGVGRSKL